MTENYETVQPVAVKRPTFLTVLCILTFVGSGIGIITSLFNQDEYVVAYASWYYWVVLILNVGTLLGAIQMWQQKKVGLYVWTLFEVLSIILMWVVYKGVMAGLETGALSEALNNAPDVDPELVKAMSGLGMEMVKSALNLGLILGTLFPVAFIIMYWVNKKHLR